MKRVRADSTSNTACISMRWTLDRFPIMFNGFFRPFGRITAPLADGMGMTVRQVGRKSDLIRWTKVAPPRRQVDSLFDGQLSRVFWQSLRDKMSLIDGDPASVLLLLVAPNSTTGHGQLFQIRSDAHRSPGRHSCLSTWMTPLSMTSPSPWRLPSWGRFPSTSNPPQVVAADVNSYQFYFRLTDGSMCAKAY